MSSLGMDEAMQKRSGNGASSPADSTTIAHGPVSCGERGFAEVERSWQALENVVCSLGFGAAVSALLAAGCKVARVDGFDNGHSFILDVDGWLADRLQSHCLAVHYVQHADGTAQLTVEC